MTGPVVITGATGFIGRALVDHLATGGVPVRALSRSRSLPERAGVTQHAYDLAGPVPREILADAAVVVHAAWDVSGPAAPAATLNVAAARTLAAACREAGARAIFVSSFAAHPGARSHYGRSKLAAETAFDTVVKPGLVAGDGGLFARLSGLLATQRIVPLVGARRAMQLIGVDELIAALAALVTEPGPGTYWVAHPEPLGMTDLYRQLARAAGGSPTLMPVPELAVLAGARAAERLGVALPVSSDSVLGLRHAVTRDTEPDLTALGLSPRRPADVIRQYATGRRP